MKGMVDKAMDKAARAILSGETKATDFALIVGQESLPPEEKEAISLAWAQARKIERNL